LETFLLYVCRQSPRAFWAPTSRALDRRRFHPPRRSIFRFFSSLHGPFLARNFFLECILLLFDSPSLIGRDGHSHMFTFLPLPASFFKARTPPPPFFFYSSTPNSPRYSYPPFLRGLLWPHLSFAFVTPPSLSQARRLFRRF